jgi:predicted RNase H-like HicB family nuclease
MGAEKTLGRLLSGTADAVIRFDELCPGCAAHGATQESALSNAQDAIRLWIDTAKEFGDRVPEPKGRRLILA